VFINQLPAYKFLLHVTALMQFVQCICNMLVRSLCFTSHSL